MSDTPAPTVLDWVGTVVLAACGALAALLETLLVPLYDGSVIVPISIVLAVLTNIVLPRLVRALVPRTGVAAAPFLAWLVVVVGFGLLTRPEGDVVLPGSPASIEYVIYGVILGGAAAGVATLVLMTPPPGRKGPGVNR
jgi:hypothetical protein